MTMTEEYSPSTETPVPGIFDSYFRATRTATWGFLMALPLLLLYEAGIVWVNHGTVGEIRITADIWLKDLIPSFGQAHELILLGVVMVVGVLIVAIERKKKVAFHSKYPGFIILESAFYAILLAVIVSGFTQWLMSPMMSVQEAGHESDLVMQLVLSLGAGLYEELFFRVILVGGLAFLLRLAFPKAKVLMYILAAVIGAITFSAIHHFGNMGDPWELSVFVYRAIFGLVFNVVFLVRGFAVVAWAHAIYDVMVVTGFLSMLQGT